MNKPEMDHGEALNALESCRLAPPSEMLKRRVMCAAQEAWGSVDAAATDVPWGVPVLRLAASFIVAALVIGFAGRLNRHAVAPWQALAHSARYRSAASTPYRASLIYPKLLVPRSVSIYASRLNATQQLSNRLQATHELLNKNMLDG